MEVRSAGEGGTADLTLPNIFGEEEVSVRALNSKQALDKGRWGKSTLGSGCGFVTDHTGAGTGFRGRCLSMCLSRHGLTHFATLVLVVDESLRAVRSNYSAYFPQMPLIRNHQLATAAHGELMPSGVSMAVLSLVAGIKYECPHPGFMNTCPRLPSVYSVLLTSNVLSQHGAKAFPGRSRHASAH